MCSFLAYKTQDTSHQNTASVTNLSFPLSFLFFLFLLLLFSVVLSQLCLLQQVRAGLSANASPLSRLNICQKQHFFHKAAKKESVNVHFKSWCTANENIQQTNMITDIAGVNNVK